MLAMEGVRVLDLTQGMDGPYCTKLLADHGAEVIKIEPPLVGDSSRRLGPFPQDAPHQEKSGQFLFFNTNKKSVTLDLQNSAGRGLFKELLPKADLVVENMGPGGMEELDLGYEQLSQLNPRLVLTSISDFGSWGPYRDYDAPDIVACAVSGYMYQMGDPDKPPLHSGVPVGRLVTGLYATFGSLLALFEVQMGGEGQKVEVSMHEALTSVLIYDTVSYSYIQRIKHRPGHYWAAHQGIRSSVQPCKDGHFGLFLNAGHHRWELMWEVMLGMPKVAEDPRFTTLEGVQEHTPELEDVARPWFMEHESREIMEQGQALGLPFAEIPDVSGVLQNPHLRERDYFQSIDHPQAGRLEYPGPSFRLGEGQEVRVGSAPQLGQDNVEVYSSLLGLGRDELIRLRCEGTI